MNAIKVYDGPSRLDGSRIVVIVTGLSKRSANSKTGDMLQTWILRYDSAPNDAVRSGLDATICGDCPLRPALKASRPDHLPRPCYVKAWQAPLSVWKARRDLPVTTPRDAAKLIAGRALRIGSYGDPAAVPFIMWARLFPNTSTHTGYTHQWRTCPDEFRFILQASVHTKQEALEAGAMGWRYFRVIPSADALIDGEILCPASKEAGNRSNCAKCGLCNGATLTDRRKSIAIVAH